jgi:hypothetical protein
MDNKKESGAEPPGGNLIGRKPTAWKHVYDQKLENCDPRALVRVSCGGL